MLPSTDFPAGRGRAAAAIKVPAVPLPPIGRDSPFEELMAHTNVYCYSVDYQTGRFRYVSPGIYRLLGYNRDTWQFSGPQEAFRQVHPDDRDCVIKIYAEIKRELIHQPITVRCDLSFVFTCRMRTQQGHYLHLSHHLSFPSFDGHGRPLADFSLVSDITAFKAPHQCQLLVQYANGTAEKTVVFSCSPSVDFSRREIEILQLVAQGLDSQEIARRLFISYHTVCTHRKNMLRKAGVKTPVELVGWGRGVGLV
ncbi:DNA-binding CsgD family transcriptional regulator [Lewinella aquimaris]|uniref:DNA-binding CsgD family transcriptional regulator n=1 Tax=Neolewinella aquimaris TaxID=1835722 RepID=A0A840EAS2_9BACT|nr:LuxR C-terminal-related transcriptional regulator [Neolewinella aquimaris]MBB4080537.1 DNA-binding CsgD family transcriptional regulator [Neolewinella aquimaris]